MNNRLFLVGAGVIAQQHAEAFKTIAQGRNELIFVADPHAGNLGAFLHNFPGAHGFQDAALMLASQEAEAGDIVVICAPPFAHAALSCLALESGRHVLCEKPLTLTLQEAESVYALARSKGLHWGCCSNRFLGVRTTEAVKQSLQASALGELYHMTFVHRLRRSRSGVEYQPASRWFLDQSRSGGGVLMDWGPYDFSVINDVLQPVRVEIVQAWIANPETALPFGPEVTFDTEQHAGATMIYHLASGGRVNVTYERSACTHGAERSIAEIEGSRGAVRWEWLCYDQHGSCTVTSDQDGQPVEHTAAYESHYHLHHRPYLYFSKLVESGNSPHAVANDQALFNFTCLRGLYEVAQTGKCLVIERGGLQ